MSLQRNPANEAHRKRERPTVLRDRERVDRSVSFWIGGITYPCDSNFETSSGDDSCPFVCSTYLVQRLDEGSCEGRVAQATVNDARPSSHTNHTIPCPPGPSIRKKLNPTFPRQTLNRDECQKSEWHKGNCKPFQHGRCDGESGSSAAWIRVLPKPFPALGHCGGGMTSVGPI